MKRIAFVSCTLVLLASTAIGQQTEEKKMNIFAGGGISIPVGPEVFKDYWKLGSSIGGGVGYSFMPWMSLYATVDYSNFPFNEQGFLDTYAADPLIKLLGGQIKVEGGSTSILAATLTEKFSLVGQTVSPYVLVGAGFYHISLSDVTVTVSMQAPFGGTETENGKSESAAGLIGGLGSDVQVSEGIDAFIQGLCVIGLTKGGSTTCVPVRAGVSFKF